MRRICKLGTSILVGVAVATVAFGLKASPAYAQDANNKAATTATPKSATAPASSVRRVAAGKKIASPPATSVTRYFVEFRGRNAATYGHLYILYGEVNSQNEITKSEIMGFHPAGDANDCENCSVFNWTIGHLVPVPAEMGASDGDLEEKYVTARYRIWLDAAEYDKLVAFMHQRRVEKTQWHAILNNCVGFGKEVAEFLGLKLPVFLWLDPKGFVELLRDANGGHPQEALKDAPGTPDVAESPTPAAPTATARASRKPKKQPVANLPTTQTAGATSVTAR